MLKLFQNHFLLESRLPCSSHRELIDLSAKIIVLKDGPLFFSQHDGAGKVYKATGSMSIPSQVMVCR